MADSDKLVNLGDLKTAYDKQNANVAMTEASSTASAAHVPGTDSEYFIYGGTLYKATADIAQGGTITPGTNCAAAPVGTSLSELKSALSQQKDWFFNKTSAFLYELLTRKFTLGSTSTDYTKEFTDSIDVSTRVGNIINIDFGTITATDESKFTQKRLFVRFYDSQDTVLETRYSAVDFAFKVYNGADHVKIGINATTVSGGAKDETLTLTDLVVYDSADGLPYHLNQDIVTITEPAAQENSEKIASMLESSNSVEIKGTWAHASYNSSGVYTELTGSEKNAALPAETLVQGGKTYAVSWPKDANYRLYIVEFQSNGTYIKTTSRNMHDYPNLIITLDANTAKLGFFTYGSTASTWEETIPAWFQFELGDEPTAHTNYQTVSGLMTNEQTVFDKMVESNIVDGAEEPPMYYMQNEYLSGKISTINGYAEQAAVNGDVFVFITDNHWNLNAQNSPKLIRYISRRCRIPRLINGGDTADNASSEYCAILKRCFDGTIYHIAGNHDYMGGTDNADLYYMMDMYNTDQIGNNKRHYYYVDNPQQKLRYIVLSAYDTNGSTVTNGYEAEQITWFTNAALNVESGWGIVVFSHCFYNISSATNEVSVLNNDVITAIDAYNGNGEILCCIQGHTHRDRVIYTPAGIPVIVTTCDKYYPYMVGQNPDINVTRTKGTITEQAFDVMILDRDVRKVYAVRVGAPALDGVGDNPGDPVQVREISFRAMT